MRDIKFQAWDKHLKKLLSYEELRKMELNGEISLHTLLSREYTNLVPLQYTGLKNKGDREIYEENFIRVAKSDIIDSLKGDFKDFEFDNVVVRVKWTAPCGYGFGFIGELYLEKNGRLITRNEYSELVYKHGLEDDDEERDSLEETTVEGSYLGYLSRKPSCTVVDNVLENPELFKIFNTFINTTANNEED